MTRNALIVGAGSGISASFARLLAKDGFKVALASRDPAKLAGLAAETRGTAHACDASAPASVDRLYAEIDRQFPRLDACLFNASARVPGPIEDVDRERAREALLVSAYGGFLVAQAAARSMLPHKAGTILLTGASASVKGYPRSAVFAMGKFALRGLAQSMARELAPKGIHVAHFVIDGGVRNAAKGRVEGADMAADSFLDPEAIAASYLHVVHQPRSAWTWEVELRPWLERF
ncbi:MAG: SDR family NAD(P)-dependent oxidoreductase [Betaproteobacteria bacterium]|nr:SDR family NAD(P)-dependent oxidoreductase [Betaproteobacteria bacterium]